ncbi:MAG: hypothetical protein IJ751_04915 [Oscillospiraceae bacterium]|nr:hypothetical protein [Oscillospiraceae bacterium]
MSQEKGPSTPEALLRDQARLRQLLESPEARALARMLEGQGAAQMKQAAQQAQKGDTAALEQLARQLAATREGALALEKLSKKLK